MKNQLGIKPEILRSDRGGEYLNKNVQDFLRNEGIQFQCTVGYTPEQNGISERRIRILMEAARTMLTQSGLPKNVWAEAVRHANYMFNRVKHEKSNETPFEMFFGKKPNLINMKALPYKH